MRGDFEEFEGKVKEFEEKVWELEKEYVLFCFKVYGLSEDNKIFVIEFIGLMVENN